MVAWEEERWLRAGPHTMRYREAGEGPPIVLVHGLGVSADYWWRNGPPLATAGYRVLAPDLPGFGSTEGPPDGLSVPAQAAILGQWMDAAGISGATLVGHSLSCQTVMEVAVRQPHSATALVLAAPTGDPRPRRLLRQALGLVRDIRRETLGLAAEVARAYVQAGPVRVWKTWMMGGQHDPLSLVPEIGIPGLVVIGTRDPVVRRDFAESLASGMSQGSFRWIEGAAHALIFTHAERFNAAVLEFLNASGVARREPR